MSIQLAEKTRKNAVGKRYRAKHIKPGLVGYSENPELGTILVTSEALDSMRPSFVGKPVVNMEHTELPPEELFNFSEQELADMAVGVVSAVGRDEDSWDYADLIIWDQETQDNIEKKGFSVSNAYVATEEGPGGTENQIPYDHELVSGEYLHMAIVPNPRYQGAKIYANSTGGSMTFKLFQGKVKQEPKPSPTPKTVTNADPGEEMEVQDAIYVSAEGDEISMEELVNAYKNQKMAGQKTALNAEDEVEVDGEKVKVGDMYNAFKAGKTAKNAELPTDTLAEEVVDETLQNTITNSAPVKKPVNKDVKNAATQGAEFKSGVQTRKERLSLGSVRYGAPVKQGGK